MSIVIEGKLDFGKVPPPVLAVLQSLAIFSPEQLLDS